MGLGAASLEEKCEKTLEKKESTPASKLCSGLPKEFTTMLNYVRAAGPANPPDYDMLREMFRNLAKKERIEYDHVYDWTIRMYFQQRGDTVSNDDDGDDEDADENIKGT